MSSVSGKAIDTKILRRIYQYLQPYKKVFWMSVGLTVLLAIVAPIRPYLIQYTIDNFILSFRKYFEEDSRNPQYFHSVRGIGYRFTPRVQ